MIRGGTSRGLYFDRDDLPKDVVSRNEVLTRAMGGPDPLQIDGLGGGHPLTSKVAVLNRSMSDDVDVDYLFLQVDPVKQSVSDVQNCGNILAGVGLYAIERGWVETDLEKTVVRVRMLNSDSICDLEMLTPNGRIQVEGDAEIDGVPGTAAPIVCSYLDIEGASCGALLPTNNERDVVNGVEVTCVDNGMPVVLVRAQDLGITGKETPEELDDNEGLKEKLESIRLQIGPVMNLGDVSEKTVPKMCLVSSPINGGFIHTRTFIPNTCHKTIGVLGAVSVATGCLLPGSIATELVNNPSVNGEVLAVEHPSGSLDVHLRENTAGVVRTARVLFKGEVFV